ncbi:MAG TPA: transposase [Mucilaginibacter sp.]|jgi:REP element-mobilizing transposase RayT|nr:transposase [Mucilaginibacter sp.]
MAVRKQHAITDDTWFITFTCHDWIPLFEITRSYDLVYNWLKLVDDKYAIKTTGFVIMPNHVHLLLRLTNDKVDLNKIIGNGKRFMAYAIVQRLEAQQNHVLLDRLSAACSAKECAKGQKHKAFEPSFDAKVVFTIDFLHQKLDYIHHNPVQGKWNLCNEFTDYEHSSAAFYELGKPHTRIDVADYRSYWY